MTVSVVIPAYNVADVVERAIRSAQAQTRPVKEIIVIDDGSSDSTADLVRGLARARPEIKLIIRDANGGPGAARNVGIAAATGDWIGILDADDTWEPSRVETLLPIAVEQDADFVVDNFMFYDEAAGRVSRLAFQAAWRTHLIDTEDFFLNRLPGASGPLSYGLLKPIIKRRFLTDNELKYDENMRVGSDFKLQAEMLLSGGRGVICNDLLYTYVQPIGDISQIESGHSRTQYHRWGDMSEAVNSLTEKYKHRITLKVSNAINKKTNDLTFLSSAVTAGDLRRSKLYLRSIAYILRRPKLLRFFLLKVPERIDHIRRRWAHRALPGGPPSGSRTVVGEQRAPAGCRASASSFPD